jgi:penicillin-binding protein 2
MGSAPFAPYAPTPEEFEELKKRADEGVFLDRARRSVQPPGSVFKPITVAAALMSGAMSATDEVYCDGLCRLGGRARPRECAGHHGQVDAAHCLAYSCNVFAYQAARRAGAETVVAWAKRFGIGNDPATRKYGLWTAPSHVMESKKWPLGEVYNLAIGKGSTGASLVSLAVYGGALVTDKVMAPLYVEEDSLPQAIQAKLPVRKVRTVGLRPEVRATILEGMLGCTEWSRGTGRSARLSGVRILAKTGTAQFKDGHKNATMLALVPAEAPKYSIVCTIENTELHGGSEVGPRLRKFLEGMVAQGYLSSSVVNGGE